MTVCGPNASKPFKKTTLRLRSFFPRKNSLSDIEEDYRLLLLAQERIAGGGLEHTVPFYKAMTGLGISDTEIEEAEELDIE